MESTGREGEMDASHLSTFRARPWEEVNSLTDAICDLQSEILVESVRISSVWEKAPRQTEGPQDLLLSSRRMGSITSRKNIGERTEP